MINIYPHNTLTCLSVAEKERIHLFQSLIGAQKLDGLQIYWICCMLWLMQTQFDAIPN